MIFVDLKEILCRLASIPAPLPPPRRPRRPGGQDRTAARGPHRLVGVTVPQIHGQTPASHPGHAAGDGGELSVQASDRRRPHQENRQGTQLSCFVTGQAKQH